MLKNKKIGLGSILASTALGVAKMGANSRCACIYHQPKMPKEVKCLKRFHQG